MKENLKNALLGLKLGGLVSVILIISVVALTLILKLMGAGDFGVTASLRNIVFAIIFGFPITGFILGFVLSSVVKV